MDYRTKPTSRKELRTIAYFIRGYFKCKNKLRFDVIDAYEKMSYLFEGVVTEIVEDGELPLDIPALCEPDFEGGYIIKVKESVYDGACKGVGGYRAHILHEMCHAILCMLGFTPILERTYRNNELKPFESMEWQAKALAGEILVPYEETKQLTINQIMFYCQVSEDCAKKRKSLK